MVDFISSFLFLHTAKWVRSS